MARYWMFLCRATVISIFQGHPVSSAHVLKLSRYRAHALGALPQFQL